jgi:hypothetical protein
MTTVRTQLGTVESARRERFEPAGSISSTNVQKAIEELDGDIVAPGGVGTVTVIASPAVIDPSTTFVYVNFAGTVALTLPDSGAWLAAHQNGLPLTIQDISGNANDSTNMITITRAGADTINGLTAVEIVSPLGGYKLRPPAAGSWAIQ